MYDFPIIFNKTKNEKKM